MKVLPPVSVEEQDFSRCEAYGVLNHEISMGSGRVNQDIFMACGFKNDRT